MTYGTEAQMGMLSRELGLDNEGLAELLGVSTSELTRWYLEGVPGPDQDRFEAVYRTVTLLSRKLKLGRVSSVARMPAPAWGGLTLLEMLAADPQEAYLAVDRTFDTNRLFD